MKKRIGFSLILCIIISGLLSWGANALEIQNDPSLVRVPNVNGIASDLAMQILQISGLTGKIQRSGRNVTVVGQKPSPGTLVAAGSEILLSLGETTSTEAEPQTVVVHKNVIQEFQPVVTPQEDSRSYQTLGDKMYAPATSTTVESSLAWYPKKFSHAPESSQSGPLLLRDTSSNGENIYNAKPLRLFPGDTKPIILAETKGWQHGWVPTASYETSTHSTPSHSQTRVLPVATPSGNSSIFSVSNSPASVFQAPSLLWMSRADAESVIKNKGLSLGTVREIAHSHIRSGIVVRQYPETGTLISRGTSIELWIVK